MRPIDVIDRAAAAHPERLALTDGRTPLTYSELRDLSCRIAQRLHQLGFAPGSHGAVLAPNDALGFVCAVGMLRAGVAWIPLNSRDAIPQVGLLLDRLEAEVLFLHPAFADAQEDLARAASSLHEVVVYDDGLEAWLADAPAEDVDAPDLPSATAAIFPTSGTTGLPRGVVHTNGSFEVFTGALASSVTGEGPPVYLAVAPLTHVSGRIALGILAAGGTVVVHGRPEPATILDALEQHRVTHTMLPPTLLYALIDEPDVQRRDLSALKTISYGSAPVRLDKLRDALSILGPVLQQGYGQTEAPMLITRLDADEHFVDGRPAPDERLSSVGRPTEFVELNILDEDGSELKVCAVGEVCVRGKFLMAGYYGDPVATAEVGRGGWHHTGDLGYLDAEGYLHLVDRKKDMIISGGFNVYSAEVERVIADSPAVAEVAVIGLPDERWGEAVTAIVVQRPGDALEREAIAELVKERLGSVKTPKRVELRAEPLPRNTTGKVLKRALREQYVQPETEGVSS